MIKKILIFLLYVLILLYLLFCFFIEEALFCDQKFGLDFLRAMC